MFELNLWSHVGKSIIIYVDYCPKTQRTKNEYVKYTDYVQQLAGGYPNIVVGATAHPTKSKFYMKTHNGFKRVLVKHDGDLTMPVDEIFTDIGNASQIMRLLFSAFKDEVAKLTGLDESRSDDELMIGLLAAFRARTIKRRVELLIFLEDRLRQLIFTVYGLQVSEKFAGRYEELCETMCLYTTQGLRLSEIIIEGGYAAAQVPLCLWIFEGFTEHHAMLRADEANRKVMIEKLRESRAEKQLAESIAAEQRLLRELDFEKDKTKMRLQAKTKKKAKSSRHTPLSKVKIDESTDTITSSLNPEACSFIPSK